MNRADWLEAETRRLLDFGARAAHPAGGFAWLDDRGRPLLDRPVHTWITSRMTHVYALGALLGHPGSAAAVAHGVAALAGPLRDGVHDGWYSGFDPAAGTAVPLGGGVKEAYQHMSVLLAFASAVTAGSPGTEDAGALLTDAVAVWDERWWDGEGGASVDTWNRAWTSLDPYRGANANMHAVEALLAVADVTGDRSRLDQAVAIATRFVHAGARDQGWLLPEHFTPDWRPELEYVNGRKDDPFRPYGATIGHSFEWSRLCLLLDRALGADAPGWLGEAAVALFATAVERGWAADGHPGFVYTIDWSGAPVIPARLHWVLAEAVAAAAALHTVTGDPAYAAHAEHWWTLLEERFVDRELGSWRHETAPDGSPAHGIWSGKPDLYHAVQATLLPRLPLRPSIAVALRDAVAGQ